MGEGGVYRYIEQTKTTNNQQQMTNTETTGATKASVAADSNRKYNRKYSRGCWHERVAIGEQEKVFKDTKVVLVIGLKVVIALRLLISVHVRQ